MASLSRRRAVGSLAIALLTVAVASAAPHPAQAQLAGPTPVAAARPPASHFDQMTALTPPFTLQPALAKPAGTQPPVLTVSGALTRCARIGGEAAVQVQGFYIPEITSAGTNEGGLFSTDEVSNTAPYHHIKRYHGIHTYIPTDLLYSRGNPPENAWLQVGGLLDCRGPGMTVESWTPASAPPPPSIPTLSRLLTASGALRYCRTYPKRQVRAHLTGYLAPTSTTVVINTGGLFDRSRTLPTSSTQRDVFAAGGLPIVPSASPRTNPGGHVIPPNTHLDLSGLLACNLRPPELEVYSWTVAQSG